MSNAIDIFVVTDEADDYDESTVILSAHLLLDDALRAARERPDLCVVIRRCSPTPVEEWERWANDSPRFRGYGTGEDVFDRDMYEHRILRDGSWHRLGQYRFDVDAPSDRFAQTVEAAERLMQSAVEMRGRDG